MTIHLEGEHANAKVMGLEQAEIEQNVLGQIQAFIDHPASTNSVRVMPDTHVGAGCTIGFTMPFEDKIIPNVVGVDVGCGLESRNYGTQLDEYSAKIIDDQVREVVPMGFDVHQDSDYHLANDFPWGRCAFKLIRLSSALDAVINAEWFTGYGIEYYKNLCGRVGYDVRRGISSVGTLGGGNHFIEVGESTETGDHWITIHSGSRGIGKAIADHWQSRATANRAREFVQENVPEEHWQYVVPDKDDPELVEWFQGGKGQSYIDSEAIREDIDNNYRVGEIHDEIRTGHPQERDAGADHDWIDDGDMDWLEGEEAHGYFIDMIFAQTYAEENRWRMFELIEDELNLVANEIITSVHNYLDFEDCIIRKGACRAHEGEKIILPFNMVDGTLILEGKGNDDWNNSSPHGAGRMMSPTQAKKVLDQDEVEQEMAENDIYSSAVPLGEAKGSYKPAELIEEAIGPTGEVVDRLVPVINIKADD